MPVQEQSSFDLIVVGGGLAGLSAAVRASELGLRVIVLEKGDGADYPCNSRQSGGIVHLAFHDPQRPQGELVGIIARATGGEADDGLARALAASGGRLIDWLQAKGVRFMRFNPQEGYRWCMAPPRALRAGIDWRDRGPDLALRLLAKQLVDLGGQLRLRSTVETLVMTEGRCTGVIAESDGQRGEWSAAHVLLADGGFQADRDLYQRFIGPGFDHIFQRGARTGTGAGLRMAQAAGAALSRMEAFYGHVLCRQARDSESLWPYPELDAIATAGIVVNGAGERIVDEGRSGVQLTNALAAHASKPLFAVFDAAIWDGPGRSARIPANPLLEQAGATILRADTVAQLAEAIGVPTEALCRTLQGYNQAVESAGPGELPIPRSTVIKPWPIARAPFMAVAICPGITYTMGGIAIDAQARVLHENGTVIPGLLAAGATTGGLEGGRNASYLGGLLKAGAFGLIAAETAAGLAETARIAPQIRPAAPALPAALPPMSTNGLARFPALRAIIRFGRPAAIALALAVAALCSWLLWPALGILALPVAAAAGIVTAIVALSYTELVRLITELLMPN